MPILLLTRPEAQSRRFLADCAAAAGRRIEAVVSPLTEIVPTGAAVPPSGDPVFTSGRAVELAGSLAGRRAWCVGGRTADLARAAGAEAVSANGDVEDLIALLRRERPDRLHHLRGADSRGGLAARLAEEGLAVSEVILYRAEERPLTGAAELALTGESPVIAPVFSPRGAALLAAQAPRPPALVVAISAAAAGPFRGRTEVRVAARPEAAEMRRLVLEAIAER